MAKVKVEDVVAELAGPIVESAGMELVDVEFVKEGAHWYLRVFIDKQGGVNLDDCQAVSEKLGPLLDERDPIAQEYMLEVSSPGLERPIKKESDFQRFKGRKIRVTTYAAVNGIKEFTGELIGLVDDKIVMESESEEVSIPREKAAQIRLHVDF